MKGYKGMDKNMRCRGMQYEVGKSYHVDGEIMLCKNGLHFCKTLTNVFKYYGFGHNNRYFEVEASGIVTANDEKIAASDIIIVRELSIAEVNRSFYGGNNYGDGDGYGNGDGWGDGWGYGNGWGYGGGWCNGSVDGYGDGCGDGYGNGRGYGCGYGNGYGNGNKQLRDKFLFI